MIKNFFEVHHECKNSLARTGVIHLPHGDVQTPVFMPVGTKGTVKAVDKDSLEEMGFEIILANTYHMYLRPGADIVQEGGGLHGFTKWNRNFLTDSGGFQVWSLSKLRKIDPNGITFRSDIDGSKHYFTPENVVQTQTKLNSDIQMQLDVCTGYDVKRKEAEKALQITTDWANRAVAEWKKQQENGYKGVLFPIVQGNFFDDLRKESAQFVSELDTPGLAIGGLSVGEPADVFAEKLQYTVQYITRSKPRYVMGIGTPEYIFEAVADGIDMFDCVQPTRIARHGMYFTRKGMVSIKQKRYEHDFTSVDPECNCKVCRTYSRAYLRHIFREQEILSSMLASYHNLYFLNDMIHQIRDAINQDRFEEFRREFLDRFHSGEV
ncbi:tRNA guanosine(34) transglycosylase Tgt [Treponema sp.]|uniref:tRNA guanosine(34) transglycosylase Tgt n=1 Tax=Treponema sp. TaxID=166 RepID=UPI00257CD86F|nr:tRNA guanosine(34) transglycosylase Tgt [Treponema sp.]MBE6353645.1 tRNA guanosine(34) transglycosylase Tgt [Treponema sp.]